VYFKFRDAVLDFRFVQNHSRRHKEGIKSYIASFAIFLLIGFVWAFLNDWFHEGSVPGGFPSLIAVGFLGAWIGSAMLWHVGPDLVGIPLLPTIALSGISIFFFSLVCGGHSHTWE